ncbi:MAG: zinc-ribbon domain-containing protein [Lachnospiraceae bacterium]|nr:zinc-ribbon domain-containing protein [Lachnospiraceae bacterium]
MYCKKCGKLMSESSKFCPGCGTSTGILGGEMVKEPWRQNTLPPETPPPPETVYRGVEPQRPQTGSGQAADGSTGGVFFGILKIVIGIIAAVILFNACNSDGTSENVGNTGSNASDGGSRATATKTPTATSAPTSTPTPIHHTSYTARELFNELEVNAYNAAQNHKGEYVVITGGLYIIDSSGDYFSINDPYEEWSFDSIHCSIHKDQRLLDKLSGFQKGDLILVTGRITDVGEIMGYSMDVEDISVAR